MTGRIEKTVFISYRRTNVPWALAIYQNLTMHGYDVFFDYQSIDSGHFEKVILENIKTRAHFLVILTPSALERCKEPGDWLRREIETAMDEKRNIVPLMLESFDFGSPLVKDALPEKLALLNKFNGLRVYSEYFFEAMDRLRERYLNIAVGDIALPILNLEAKEFTKTQKIAASEAPPVEKDQLTAQEWRERGFVFWESKNLNEAIRCYTEAILLQPNDISFYSTRGLAYLITGDLDHAITDYNEIIRLKPDSSSAYYNRGIALFRKGDYLNALSDFQKSIEIRPEHSVYGAWLARVLKELGHVEEAKNQNKVSRELSLRENMYDQACFEAICGNIDKTLELLRIWLKEIPSDKNWARADPDFESIHNDPGFKELVGE